MNRAIMNTPIKLDRIKTGKLIQKEYLELTEGIDWNSYKSNAEEHLYLKKNIGYALFGSPLVNNVLGYSEEQAKHICEIYSAICNNHYLSNKCELHIRIIYIYICFESDTEGDGRVPVFVLKKCVESRNPCTIFIDNIGRVYEGWTAYLENNKLPECIMICPEKGKYTGTIYLNEKGEEEVDVVLEYHDSPACSLSNKVLGVVDMTGTVVSVGTALVFGASTLVALSPPVLAVAGIGGLGAGVMGMCRSAMSLWDRSEHQQSVGLDNAEARGHWLTTGVGAVSASTTGAVTALTSFTRSGAVIGNGAQAAFNTLSVVNILGSTANCGVTMYNFYEKWSNNDKITFMDVFQLSSSILFFQMSVMNFRTASTIIQETQTSVISDYKETLRSNRHRNALRKAQLEAKRINGDIKGNAEIIKGITHISNPNEYFAGLVKMNKGLNAKGARYTISADGNVVINSVTIVDPVEFNNMSVNGRKSTLNNLPASQPSASLPKSTPNWLNSKIADITTFCNGNSSSLPVIGNIREYSDTIALLLKGFSTRACNRILEITVKFLGEISAELEPIKKIHPLVNVTVMGVQYIVEYLKRSAILLHMDETQLIDITFEDLPNKIRDIITSFKEWWTNQQTNFYSIPNDYIDLNEKVKYPNACKTCQGIYFA